MFPRGNLDIGWRELAFALRAGIRPHVDPDTLSRRIEDGWVPGETLVALSVRSALDALLTALDLPHGSEVIVSAITIRDMTRVIEEHGLTVVPVDLDGETLAVNPVHLESLITPRTKAVLFAHIFGARSPLAPLAKVTRRHGLLLIEDCAQALADPADRGDPDADVSLFSFGPIKTNTALGGGIARIRNRTLLERTRAVTEEWPRQPEPEFRARVRKYIAIKAVSQPVAFGLLAKAASATGRSHDQVISHALRGFPGPDFFTKIRRQPSSLLLQLLERRITTFERARVDRRIAMAHRLTALMPAIDRPGRDTAEHTYWVFPIRTPEPDALMHRLWKAGFDATRGASSLAVVEPPPERPDLEPAKARQTMAHLLYLPVSPAMRPRDLERLAAIVNETAATALADRLRVAQPGDPAVQEPAYGKGASA